MIIALKLIFTIKFPITKVSVFKFIRIFIIAYIKGLRNTSKYAGCKINVIGGGQQPGGSGTNINEVIHVGDRR